MSTDTIARIRQILAEHAGLEADPQAISVDDDLFDGGMTSHASVNVMLAIEDEFDIEFPDELLQRSTFTTIGRIDDAVTSLQE